MPPSAYIRVRSMSLPLELSDMVIDHLHADKTSLQSCSLVCKSWTRRSQRHLFAVITVSARVHKRAANRFSPFLRAKPDIASHITTLVIENEEALSFSALHSVIYSLPELLSLMLHSCLIIGSDPRRAQAQPRRSYQVHPMKTVDVGYCNLRADTLYQFLGLFTSIDHLSLYRITLLDPRHYRARAPELSALRVKSLDVTAIPVSITASLLRHSAITKTMVLLSLSQPACLCALQTIELLPNPFVFGLLCGLFDIAYQEVRPANIFDKLPMRDCKMLRQLTHFLPSTDPEDMHSFIHAYLGSLSSLQNSVQEIRLILCRRVDLDEPDVDLAHWEEVDAMILDGPHDLHIVLDTSQSTPPHTEEDIDELEEFLEQRLPGAFEDGVFTVGRPPLPAN